MIDLSVQIGVLKLKNPVLVASGTYGYGQESSDLVDLSRLGAVITKSITPEPRVGNPPPRIVELPAGMLNSIGLANVGLDAFVADKLPFLRTIGTDVIVNIAGRTADDFLTVLRRLDELDGISGYELNFSCPNVKEGGLEFSQDARMTDKTTSLLRRATSRPIITKLTPNVTRISEIAKAAEQGGADAVSLINTLVGMSIDTENRRPKLATARGGYSGPAIKPVALAKVYETASAVDIPIIGIGGIMCATDAIEFFLAGASAIEVGTANYVNPSIGVTIVDEIERYCVDNGFSAMKELTGALIV